jgi:hypothetical protein
MVAHIAITMQQGAAIINLETYARDNNIGWREEKVNVYQIWSFSMRVFLLAWYCLFPDLPNFHKRHILLWTSVSQILRPDCYGSQYHCLYDWRYQVHAYVYLLYRQRYIRRLEDLPTRQWTQWIWFWLWIGNHFVGDNWTYSKHPPSQP